MGCGFHVRLFVVAASCVAMFVSVFVLKDGVDTDLFSLLSSPSSDEDSRILSSLGSAFSSRLSVICETAESAAKCREAFLFDAPFDMDEAKKLLMEKGDGLLSEVSRRLLLSNDVDRIRRSTKRRDYTAIGMFPKSADPWYFLHDFVIELSAFIPKDMPDGVVHLTCEYDSSDPMRGDEALARLVDIASCDDAVSLSGPPFHSFLAKRAVKREINILSFVSLAISAVLGFLLFRSFRFVPSMVFSLGFGFAVAVSAVGLLPGRPHVLVFLFGTTLVGLGVDYVYHSLSGCSRSDLVKAFLTTVLAFTPLLFSSVRILREMALFTVAGLSAIFVSRILPAGEEKA